MLVYDLKFFHFNAQLKIEITEMFIKLDNK